MRGAPRSGQSVAIDGLTYRIGVTGRQKTGLYREFSASAEHPSALAFPEGEYLKGLLARECR